MLVRVGQPIKVDLIWHRGSQATIPTNYDCPIINHPDMERLCGDKIKIAELFADISPKTKAISSYREFVDAVTEWGISLEEKLF